jgi:hypothetical protein
MNPFILNLDTFLILTHHQVQRDVITEYYLTDDHGSTLSSALLAET